MLCVYNLLVMLNLIQHLTTSLFLTFSADRSRNEFGMTWRVSITFFVMLNLIQHLTASLFLTISFFADRRACLTLIVKLH